MGEPESPVFVIPNGEPRVLALCLPMGTPIESMFPTGPERFLRSVRVGGFQHPRVIDRESIPLVEFVTIRPVKLRFFNKILVRARRATTMVVPALGVVLPFYVLMGRVIPGKRPGRVSFSSLNSVGRAEA